MAGSSTPETQISLPPENETYVLQLFVAGLSALSRRAIVNTRHLCEEHIPDNYRLDVVDLCQYPEMAGSEQIIAAPTLIKKSPLPVRRFIGDMSRTEIILQGLGLPDPDSNHPS